MKQTTNLFVRITVVFLCILAIFFIITITFWGYNIILITDGYAQESQTQKEINKIDLAVIIYAVALGVIGIFNMYNALEIYKKKEDIAKELNKIVFSYSENINDLNLKKTELISFLSIKNKEINLEFKSFELEIEKIRHSLKDDLNKTSERIEEHNEKQIINYYEKIAPMIKDFQKQYNDIKKNIETTIIEFSSFKDQIWNEHNRFYHSHQLYSLIPKYLLNEKNRTLVQSALFWFSQHGNEDDIDLIIERQSQISPSDSELFSLCSTTVEEIKNRTR